MPFDSLIFISPETLKPVYIIVEIRIIKTLTANPAFFIFTPPQRIKILIDN